MPVTNDIPAVDLTLDELRAVAGYAVACAAPALTLFERQRPGDPRPRAAIEAAQTFADGAARSKLIRDNAWSAMRAYHEARDAGQAAAGEAARAAVAACGAAFLHPLAKATQVKHILGSAAHAACAFELLGEDRTPTGTDHIALAAHIAGPVVLNVLRRYPPAPLGGGRVGELVRQLDGLLRAP